MSCLLRAGIGSEEEAVQDPTRTTFQSGMRFGVYEIDCHADGSLYELGRGAMGVTYRATDTSLQRKVALKIIRIDLAERSADARERFMREARAAAALRHENIATIHQFGMRLETGQYFYAMELIEGETLDERIHRAGPLDARTTIQIAEQVTSALATAEKHGLVHRDLKPANLMLVSPDDETSNNKKLAVKIIDFGLAKAIHTASAPKSLTHDRFVGTPAFASPEQFEHSALDVRSDIYSLGATLWFALTGKTPFAGRSVEEIHRAQQSNALPVEQLKAAHVPARVRSLLTTMLALEPASRPSAHDLAARLQLCSAEASRVRRTHFVFAAAGILIFGLSAFLAFVSLHTQNSIPNLRPPGKSIAVLPFRNLSGDAENAYFVEGIQDEILTRLSKIADLKVISRTSTQQYQNKHMNLGEIAKQIGVVNILQGSVQKAADQIRVNVQLINVEADSPLWAESYDRKLTDIFGVESEVAKAIADQLRAKLTGQEEEAIAATPTDNPDAYDSYLRGIAYTLKPGNTTANALGAQKYFREAVRLDPKFALAWALLSYTDAVGYLTTALQPTAALRDEAGKAAETAFALQPKLGEALLARGQYHYACLKDYDTAVHYFLQARQALPNSSRIPEVLAYVARRQGEWNRSESYFNEAERLDPRNANLSTEHALLLVALRRFPEALRKCDQVLDITPDDLDTIALKAGIAQARGELPLAAALLATLRPAAGDTAVLGSQVYQAILERRPTEIISRLKDMLAESDPSSGNFIGNLRFQLGWAQDMAGDHAAAKQSWERARGEVEFLLKEQPENQLLMQDLALINMALEDKVAALAMVERAMKVNPIAKDAISGPGSLEIFARVTASLGEPDRAIPAIKQLLSIPYAGPFGIPLTPALLRLDPMFDPLRNDRRFQRLLAAAP